MLAPLIERRGFEAFTQVSILDPRDHNKNYRTPDIAAIDPKHVIRRSTEGPVELAIEVLSPDDESRDKLPYYASRGVKELWIVDPDTRAIEVDVLRGATYFAILQDDAGITRAPAFELKLSVRDGPKLRIAWADGAAEV